VHQRATLGLGGRSILISREWSGKTLTDHHADAKARVRAVLGVTEQHHGEDQGEVPERYAWEMTQPDDPDVDLLPQRLLRAVFERIRWRNELRQAQQRAGTGHPVMFR
jgi:hypothetical protein